MDNRKIRPAHLRGFLFIALAILVSLVSLPLAHASSFAGWGASNLNATGCPGNCFNSPFSTSDWDGTTFQNPLAASATVVSVTIAVASIVPDKVGILTSAITPTLTHVTSACNAYPAGACPWYFTATGQSYTLLEVEGLSSITPNAINSITLAAPPTVSASQWTAVVFHTSGATSSCCFLISCEVGCDNSATAVTEFDMGNSPAPGSFNTAGTDGVLPGVVGATFQGLGTGGAGATVTQCYGNCGNPAITLANTNSTHAIAFNQTITLLYEFQSNLNGFLLNVTTSLTKTYTNGQAVFFGVYTIPSCPLGATPFSAQCPGLRQQSGSTFFTTFKGRVSLANLQVPVSNGQWVGIAVSGQFQPLDLNDTNTSVSLFQTNEGLIPAIIQQAVPTNPATSKMGLWSWIRGNTVVGTPLPNQPVACGSFATIDCWAPAFINGACSFVTAACQTSATILWSFILSMLFLVTMAASVGADFKLPMGELFIFLFVGWILIFAGLGLTLVWVPVFFIMLLAVAFSKHTGKYF